MSGVKTTHTSLHSNNLPLCSADSQEDRIVVVPDLNIHVPAGRKSGVDPPTKKSFFAVFDGREYTSSRASHMELTLFRKMCNKLRSDCGAWYLYCYPFVSINQLHITSRQHGFNLVREPARLNASRGYTALLCR